MTHLVYDTHQIRYVNSFQELISTPFDGEINAICWSRQLMGDFSEIVAKIELTDNITVIEEDQLHALQLSEQGQLARNVLLHDMQLLQDHGALPSLNAIRHYDRDTDFEIVPTDVYSFHADRSPVPTDTFLCTYHGDASEILPNAQCQQMILIPEIRQQLKKLYAGPDGGFEAFLSEHSFDLHYKPFADARPISLGVGHLWRLAVDHPESKVAPSIHRAPEEKSGEVRLLMIC